MPTMSAIEAPSLDLKEACVQVAREVIAESGLEALSLRDVARRLGVSHQAPYKHYPSRDHLLAEVMRRCFVGFAQYLEQGAQRPEFAQLPMGGLGRLYLEYAQANPLEYRLMFGTPWPPAADHPELQEAARHAFDMLRAALRRLHGVAADAEHHRADLDAVCIWACVHGLSTLMQSNCMARIDETLGVKAELPEHLLQMLGRALQPQPGAA
jgi:AcrR family transcriptional regulator